MRALIALLLLVISLSPIQAQEDPPPWADQQQQLISAHVPKNKFGADSIDMDGHFLAIGTTIYSPEYYIGLGVVVIFERVGEQWEEQAFILPPEEDRVDETGFGARVDLNGDYLAVYASNRSIPNYPGSPENAVYIYRRNGEAWELETKFTRMPDAAGAYVSHNIRFVGDTLFVEPHRQVVPGAPDVSSIAGYLYKRIDGIWVSTETVMRPAEANPVDLRWWRADIVNDGNTLTVFDDNQTTYIFNRALDGWTLTGVIQLPAGEVDHGESLYEILFNDSGDNAVLLWGYPRCNASDCWGTDFYHFDGVAWQLEHRALGEGEPAMKIHEDTAVFSQFTYNSSTRLPTSSTVFIRVDGGWVKQSTLAIYEFPTQHLERLGASNQVETDGTYVITGLHWWEPGEMRGFASMYAIKIPGVNQDAPQTVGKANTALLSVPPASEAVREIGSSDYASVNVSLKTRPTQKVILQLSTNGSALLDVGGPASQILNMTFNRKNWNIPRPVRVRLAPGQSGPLSAVIREKVIGGSAFEYTLVKPLSVRVEVPGLIFAPDTPSPDAALANDAPVTFTWRPYSLATRYIVKLKRTGSTRQFKYPVDPATACTIDLCTLTLEHTALPKGSTVKWRVVAQDQPASFSRATTWRKFTFTPPQ